MVDCEECLCLVVQPLRRGPKVEENKNFYHRRTGNSLATDCAHREGTYCSFEESCWGSATQKGCTVRFHVADVFLPNVEELLAAFREQEELEGVVIDFSDSGSKTNAFAVIEVIQKGTVVVPVDKLKY